jgi:drug/metabolite transporter (DMT)-like permease
MSGIFVKLAGATAGTTAFYRCLLALPGLLIIAAIERSKSGGRSRKEHGIALLAGVFLGVDLLVWTHAVYAVGAGIATVLGNLQVVVVAFIAWVFLKEHLNIRFLFSLPVVMVGVVLVAGLANSHNGHYDPVAGIVYGLATSVAYGGYILVLRRSTVAGGPVAGPLADATLGGAITGLVLGLATGELTFTPGWASIGWLALLALTSQTFGWLLITPALPYLPASISSLLLLLQPAATLVLAYIVLSQRPTWIQIVGALLVCGGVLYTALASGSKVVASAEPAPG